MDNIAEKLIDAKINYTNFSNIKITRLGHPARVLPQIIDTSLDVLLNKYYFQ